MTDCNVIGISSKGILALPHLETFLDARVTRLRSSSPSFSAVAVWGHRPTARVGEDYARAHGLPLLRLEDGFLRSLDLGCHGAPPLSLVVDGRGIYYDASQPSDLEHILEHEDLDDSLLGEAEKARAAILAGGLSKYNHAPAAPDGLLGDASRPRVLLIDQTAGDVSIRMGGADASSFQRMLDAARTRFPNGRFFIKTHPDVIAGKKKGYLTDSSTARDMTIITEDCAPLSLLAQADAVFTVTSQMGFEALLLNKDVHCFGLPFYAGWGMTRDESRCERRTRARSTLEILAAAYIRYARYVNPFTGKRCDIHEVIRILARQREMNERNAGQTVCLHFDRWKRPHARAFLASTRGSTYFSSSLQHAIARARTKNGRLVVWSSRADADLDAACAAASVAVTRMEDGFIRSVGLGSDFRSPYSLVLDDQGIYYDPSRPNRLETILRETAFSPEMLERASALRHHIVNRGITKYNMTARKDLRFPRDRTIILTPGQVEDDASVRQGGGEIRTNLELLAMVRKNAPHDYIVYKPHPDVERRNRRGRLDDDVALRHADCVVRDIGMHHLLEHVDEIHTLTSLTGFEALLRGLTVQTYGGPFYAGWGLTHDRLDFPRRGRSLSLDALVAGSLILYPAYHDWKTMMFCGPEEICARLLEPHPDAPERAWVRVVWMLREAWKHIAGT